MLIEIGGDQQSNNLEKNLLAERTLTMTKTNNMHIMMMVKKAVKTQQLKNNKMAIIYDHTIQFFIEETMAHIQIQGLL